MKIRRDLMMCAEKCASVNCDNYVRGWLRVELSLGGGEGEASASAADK